MRAAERENNPKNLNSGAKSNRAAARVEHVLIDYENVQPTPSEWGLLQGSAYKVTVFLGPKQATVSTDLVLAMQKLGGEYVVASIVGKNAVDFHIAYYLGRLLI